MTESFVVGVDGVILARLRNRLDKLSPAGVEWCPVDCADPHWSDSLDAGEVRVLVSRHNPTEAELDRLPSLLFLQMPVAGYEHLDWDRLGARGIPVGSNGGANAASVAEHVFLLLLLLNRQFAEQQRQIRTGDWRVVKYKNRELGGLRLGVIGLGYCGTAVVQRALGFAMTVAGQDIRPPGPQDPFADCVERLSLDELLRVSDVVTLHVPLTAHTRHLMNDRTLSRMKHGALLINTARGGVVDEQALVRALQSGRLRGAGLDVFEREPLPPESPLLSLPQVILTPHAAPSRESDERLVRVILENIEAMRTGKKLIHEAMPYPGPNDERVIDGTSHPAYNP